jgi:hypothetical protein
MATQIIDLACEREKRRRIHELGIGSCRYCGAIQVTAANAAQSPHGIIICGVCRGEVDFEPFGAFSFDVPTRHCR